MPANRVHDRVIGGLECMVLGSGPPLVILPGLAPENGRPTTRPIRNGEVQAMARHAVTHTVYWVGRPTGLTRGTTFAQITALTADALRAEFDEPVRVLGNSTADPSPSSLPLNIPSWSSGWCCSVPATGWACTLRRRSAT